MSSILDMLAGSLDEQTISQMAKQLGADDALTQQAIQIGVPMLLGALNKNTQSQSGAESLHHALVNDHDGSILDDVLGNVTKPSTQADGAAILGHILGNKEDLVEQGIAQVTGLDKQTSTQLMTMVAPLVLGALGKQQQQQGLDAQGIAGLLQTEREENEQLSGLAALLDLDGDGDATNDIMNLGGNLLNSLFGRRR